MHPDPADGLTDELAAQIGTELELAPGDETPASVLVRPGEAAGVEIVLGDEERGDIVVALQPAAGPRVGPGAAGGCRGGVTRAYGAASTMPAPTVSLLASSTRMKAPVARLTA